MKDFIKKNIVLVIGIAIPIVMAIFLGFAALLPALLVAPPQYNILFSTGYNSYPANNGLQFNVVNGKLVVNYVVNNVANSPANYSQNLYPTQSLYLYEVKTKTTRKISFTIPPIPADQKSFSTIIDIPAVSHLTIDDSAQSPDGYTFNTVNNYNNGMGVSDLFYRSSPRTLSLSKDGYTVVIAPNNINDFNFYTAHFIGWIIPEQRK